MKLFVLAVNVWDADTYIGWRDRDESSDPQRTDWYIFNSLEKAEEFALTLPTDDDIYNQGFIYHGDVSEEKILELTGCESMEDFAEVMEDPECKGKFNEKRELAAFIVQEYDDSSMIDDVECANYDIDKPLEDAILVFWSWDRHIGYARKFIELRRADSSVTKATLTKYDKVFVTQCDVLLTPAEVEDAGDDLHEVMLERLNDCSWQWQNPKFMEQCVKEF